MLITLTPVSSVRAASMVFSGTRFQARFEAHGRGYCLTLHCASAAGEPPARAVSRNPSGRARHERSSVGQCRERGGGRERPDIPFHTKSRAMNADPKVGQGVKNRGSSLLLRVSYAGMGKQSAGKGFKKQVEQVGAEIRQQQICPHIPCTIPSHPAGRFC